METSRIVLSCVNIPDSLGCEHWSASHFLSLPIRAVSVLQTQGSPGLLPGRTLSKVLPCDKALMETALVF